MKTTFRYLFALLVILSMLLSACAPAATEETPDVGEPAATEPAATEPVDTEPAATEPEATEAVATEPAATEPVVGAEGCPEIASGQSIEMWSPLTGPDGDEMSALANRFSQENEWGITVAHVAQPEYVQKLNAAAAAGKMPAMTVVRGINVGELAERNVLQPMSDEILAIFGDDIASEFPENVWTVGEYEGQRYSFPLDIHPLVMYYNKDMLAAAGVAEPTTTPWTRAEFEDAIAKLEASGVTPISIGTAFQAATLFQSFIRQFGGALANDEGTQATFNSEAAVEAMNYINDLKQKYSPDISGAGDPEMNTFKQGQAAIAIHGPWHISDIQKLPFAGFAPIPQVGDEFYVWAGSHQLGLTSEDPAQQAAAACWIKWLSENSLDWAKAGQVPARNSVRLSSDLGTLAAPISMIAESADRAILLPQVAELEGALWGQFGPVVDGYLMGEVTDLQAALDEANAKSQQLLDENAAKYGP